MTAADVAEYWRQMAKTLKSVRRMLPKISRHSISSPAAYTEKIGLESAADMQDLKACKTYHLATQWATGMSYMLLL